MLFEFKGIEVLGRCLDDAVELALDSVRNLKNIFIYTVTPFFKTVSVRPDF